MDWVLGELTEANEAKARLTAKVTATRPEKDRLTAEKQVMIEQRKKVEARNKKLWKNSHHYKSKSKRLAKQLAIISWLRGASWGRGMNWGFENFQTLHLNPDIYNFNPETVTPELVGITESSTTELETLGIEFFPDVQVWGEVVPNPYRMN